jgi:hypothetical protein
MDAEGVKKYITKIVAVIITRNAGYNLDNLEIIKSFDSFVFSSVMKITYPLIRKNKSTPVTPALKNDSWYPAILK